MEDRGYRNDPRYIMSIDIGTQSVRAMVFTQSGDVVATERLLSEPPYSLQLGWAELPADSVWQNVCTVCQRLRAHMQEKLDRVEACAITANRDNIIALDREGNYLRDWITWVDKRRTPEALADLNTLWKGEKRIIRLFAKELAAIITTRSKFNWFKYHEPQTYERAASYLTMSGLVTYKLTGERADSYGMQAGVLPFNGAKNEFYTYDFLWQAMGVRRDQLDYRLCGPAELLGRVSPEAAALTGLPEGLPIVASGGDKQCEVLGAGAFSEDTAVISYGTMATISVTSDRYVSDRAFSFYSFSSSIRGKFYEEFLIDRGYWLVTWFCRQYALEEDFPSFLQEMNERASRLPPGSQGLFVYPFWAPHYVLYPEARGAIMGLTDDHRPEHIYRAILESVAFSLKMGFQKIRKKTKRPIRELIVVGGGAESDVAMQLTADIFNVPVQRLSVKEVCGMGAAIAAGIYAGVYEDERDGVEHMRRVDRVFTPIAENVKLYEEIYSEIYLKMYKANLPIFRKLNELGKIEVHHG